MGPSTLLGFEIQQHIIDTGSLFDSARIGPISGPHRQGIQQNLLSSSWRRITKEAHYLTLPCIVIITNGSQGSSAPWSGPLNRDLLVFNSFVKALNRSYRNLLEMLTLSFFLNGLVQKDRKDYYQIADSLPYLADVNVALGLVCKFYLERVVEGKSAAEALELTEKAFPTCNSVKSDLEKGFAFWSQLFTAIETLDKARSIEKSTFEMFLGANEWLQKVRF
ncbi:temperature dependent protein affecting M2 dsRNA replication-domain-containing protein [Parasitella parasitica]|nr:temperature dependent protein affecting M2 dsRNA replication-domain-containing protein [Parasitella parasitica]